MPFGIGLLLIWMVLMNYFTDSDKDTAASEMVAAACTRSIFGAALPFASTPMYDTLGVHWASSLLRVISFVLAIVRFVFIKDGARIKEKSKACQGSD